MRVGLYRAGPARSDPDEIEARASREKAFYNDKGVTSYHVVRRWIWRALGEFRRNAEIKSFYDPAGKVVLDYGCGPGYLTTYLIANGAVSVTGIDVSEGEIEQARAKAEHEGLAPVTRFLVADAHATEFPDDSFDLIVGDSILHHLDMRVALAEIRRILRPGGRAVFMEPMWHNPILRIGRALTPTARTPDEHPLTTRDWELCAQLFGDFEHHEREFLTIPLMPLNLVLPRRAQRALARLVGAIDDRVLERFPSLRKHSRITFLVLQ
ncbi:MAG TPA: class I SAM-dependent methyltransferase [Solirubrobacteraceae bacterium]|nr:class I SAM-dependent methyltransferase [Solirubrobacteraceae bacterium]